MSENMNEKVKDFSNKMLKVGTIECTVFSAVVALIAILAILLLGFWETVLVVVIVALGAFIGGVKDKKEWLRKVLNKIVPSREPKAYKAYDVRIRAEKTEEKAEEKAEEVKEEMKAAAEEKAATEEA